ncbi:MAG: hypothetical protein ACLSG5_04295 [Oscillospiraceae bacterium]
MLFNTCAVRENAEDRVFNLARSSTTKSSSRTCSSVCGCWFSRSTSRNV